MTSLTVAPVAAIQRRTVEGTIGVVMVSTLALGDALAQIRFNTHSGTALASIALAIALLLSLVARVRHHGRPSRVAWPLVALLVWAACRTLVAGTVGLGLQNIIVLAVFVCGLLVCAREGYEDPSFSNRVVLWVRAAGVAAASVYLLTVAAHGLGNNALTSARAFAICGVIAVAAIAGSSGGQTGRDRVELLVVLAAIAASLSRTALIASLLIVTMSPVVQMSIAPSRARRFARSAVVALLLLVGVVVMVQRVDSMNERFFGGDRAVEINGTAINASGRAEFWEATFESATKSMVIGAGSGTAEEVIRGRFMSVEHPHNDFLRVLHDYGIVGVVLLALGVLRISRLGRTSPFAPAGLTLLGLGLVMITDNAIVYVFAMAPAAALLGAAVGSALWSIDTSPQDRPTIPERVRSTL